MTEPICDLCGNPTDGYCCERCTQETARYLAGAELAGEVETTVARQARYAARGGPNTPEPVPADTPDTHRPSQRAETFAWAASRELPIRGALRAERLPVDLNASAKAAHAFNAITTWARHVEESHECERIPEVKRGEHPAAVAAAWLLGQLDWLRHQREAEEAFSQLRAAGATIRRIVDRPADQEVVGRCDCEAYLYAYEGASVVACRDCGLRWDVKVSRTGLMDALRDRFVTVAEFATLGALAYPELPRKKVKWLAESWVRTDRPGHIQGWDSPDGTMYLFGEVIDRLSRHVAQLTEKDHANVSA